MTCLKDVADHVRSKNAGPFWVTIDVFFGDPERFEAYRGDPALSREGFAELYEVEVSQVKRFEAPALAVLKFAYPRPAPQGGAVERDMHAGQQYVRLLEAPLTT